MFQLMADSTIKIESITKIDVPFVLEVQSESYGETYIEDERVFIQMISVYPQGCLKVNVDGFFASYVFFHPYHNNMVKPLDSPLVLTGTEDCMYLHDLAVHRSYRRMGLTKILMEEVDNKTRKAGFSLQALTAVQNSHNFWRKHGFRIEREIESYGGSPAYYMKREL